MISYFFRNSKCGFSIEKVFSSVIENEKKQEDVDIVYMPSANSMPWDVLKNSIYTFKHRNKNGINHITGHIHDVVLGLLGCKIVLTIHDLVFLDNVRNPIKRFYKKMLWLYIPVLLADKLTCISTHTKQNILKYIKTDKLEVVYNPIDPAFVFVPREFNHDNPRILHIGTGWNKNLQRTIEALNGIKCHLRIIGKLSNDMKLLLNRSQIDYSNAVGLSDEEIRQEYINCDIINFPSIYEGFGMPIIEGQATGRIVVTSKIEPLIEISGDAVVYVQPESIASIRNAYLQIINNLDAYKYLLAEGLENVKRFHIDKIVADYNKVYDKVLS